METQQKNSFDLVSLKKIAINITILFAPQILAAILEQLANVNFGEYSEVSGLIISALSYIVKGYIQGQANQVPMVTVNPKDTNNTL